MSANPQELRLLEISINENAQNEILTLTFKELADRVVAIVATSGKKIRPYTEGLPHFRALPLEGKMKVVDQLRFYHSLCMEQINDNYSIKDNHTFIWRALRALGLTPTSDLLSYVTDDNIVEIYSADNLQLFRNFKFFDVCSYSLEEMHCVEWWNLYQRDDSVTTDLIHIAGKICNGEFRGGLKPGIATHVVRETNSHERLSVNLSYNWLAPVFSNKKVSGVIVVATADIMEN